jgi:type I restriction enzyme R subunit
VNQALLAIARGEKRILLTLATGTGKTMVAFQLVSKLRRSSWKGGEKPRVLYLADRNILIDQPKDDYFEPVFGDVVHKIGGGRAQRARQIFFALYQSLESERGDEEAREFDGLARWSQAGLIHKNGPATYTASKKPPTPLRGSR